MRNLTASTLKLNIPIHYNKTNNICRNIGKIIHRKKID